MITVAQGKMNTLVLDEDSTQQWKCCTAISKCDTAIVKCYTARCTQPCSSAVYFDCGLFIDVFALCKSTWIFMVKVPSHGEHLEQPVKRNVRILCARQLAVERPQACLGASQRWGRGLSGAARNAQRGSAAGRGPRRSDGDRELVVPPFGPSVHDLVRMGIRRMGCAQRGCLTLGQHRTLSGVLWVCQW